MVLVNIEGVITFWERRLGLTIDLSVNPYDEYKIDFPGIPANGKF